MKDLLAAAYNTLSESKHGNVSLTDQQHLNSLFKNINDTLKRSTPGHISNAENLKYYSLDAISEVISDLEYCLDIAKDIQKELKKILK